MIKVAAVLFVCCTGLAQGQDLPTASPESQGFDSAKLAHVLQTISKAQWPVDSVLVMRNGNVILDAYFYPYGPNQLHDLRSVTKSVTSSLLGISIAQGKLDGLGQKVLPFFPQQLALEKDERKQAMSLGNLVDMRSGLEWSEWPYGQNSTIYRMQKSADWNQFVLAQPMDGAPGDTFNYNGGNMNLLSDIIQQRWSMPIQDVAALQLFAPLGISRFIWSAGAQGRTVGEAGLFLQPQDMAKLGQLWLSDGVWHGQRLLPAGWTGALAQDALPAERGQVYRRGFWGDREKTVFSAMGRHGQNVFFDVANQMVVVITGKFADSVTIPDVLSLIDQAKAPQTELPANAQAQTQLAVTLKQIAQASIKPVPKLGAQWYGKTWRLAANPLGIDAIRFAPDPKDAGALRWEVTWAKGINIWPVGIDGAYRFKADAMANNAPLALRAHWQDENTLLLDTQYPQGSTTWHYRLHFKGERLDVQFRSNEDIDLAVTGQLQIIKKK